MRREEEQRLEQFLKDKLLLVESISEEFSDPLSILRTSDKFSCIVIDCSEYWYYEQSTWIDVTTIQFDLPQEIYERSKFEVDTIFVDRIDFSINPLRNTIGITSYGFREGEKGIEQITYGTKDEIIHDFEEIYSRIEYEFVQFLNEYQSMVFFQDNNINRFFEEKPTPIALLLYARIVDYAEVDLLPVYFICDDNRFIKDLPPLRRPKLLYLQDERIFDIHQEIEYDGIEEFIDEVEDSNDQYHKIYKNYFLNIHEERKEVKYNSERGYHTK